ncbi:MAG: TIGR04086 family membrane protein [Ruminococcaceae bacterium]|nr:TIGR04086 family membrane protein [Oscillospiraceae bacterium]
MNRNQRSSALVRSRTTPVAARSRSGDESPLFTSVLKCSLWGLLVTFISGIILISVLSAAALASPDPLSLISSLSLIALFPSAFIGGFVTAKRVKDAPALCGIICGGLSTVCAMLFSIVLKGISSSNFELWQSLLLHALVIVFSVLGALAGNVKRVAKRGKRRFGR